jgi:hypothetical protein
MKNGNKTRTKKTPARQKLPPKPVFTMPRRQKNGLLSEADGKAYAAYILQLRDWLWALPDARFDREIRKLSSLDLYQVNALNTYEDFQNGGPMRVIAHGAHWYLGLSELQAFAAASHQV